MRVKIFEYLPILHTGRMADTELLHVRSYANEAVTSLLGGSMSAGSQYGELPNYQIF